MHLCYVYQREALLQEHILICILEVRMKMELIARCVF